MDPVKMLAKAAEYRFNANRCFAHIEPGTSSSLREWWDTMGNRWLHMAETEEVMASQCLYLERSK